MNVDNIIEVYLFSEKLGVLFLDPETRQTYFEYDKNYLNKKVQPAPILMPVNKDNLVYGPYYDELSNSFRGLPPMIADALPDFYGFTVIKEYLTINGYSEEVTPIRLLSYIGSRGMGALEFVPSSQTKELGLLQTDLSELSDLSYKIIDDRKGLFKITKEDLFKLFQFSTSAGGAKPKAILSYNNKENLYAYPCEYKKGFVPLIIKFDGLDNQGVSFDSGRIEYIYYKMAKECGINMTPCGFFKDGTKSHFHTVRFDRTTNGEKLHMQTLAGITGLSPKQLHSYNVVFDTILKLGLAQGDIKNQFKIMIFNYLSSNDDYHIKNISFLMNKKGIWSLSPAYDITFPYEVSNIWRKTQPLSINGKVKDINISDFLAIATRYGVKQPVNIINSIIKELKQFRDLAIKYELPEDKAKKIEACFRFDNVIDV